MVRAGAGGCNHSGGLRRQSLGTGRNQRWREASELDGASGGGRARDLDGTH